MRGESMITKKEIKQEVSKIRKLDKAHEVCYLNDDLQLLLEEEARTKMFMLLTRIENRFREMEVPRYKLEGLFYYRNDLNTSRTIDGEYNGIWGTIHNCEVFIDVMVLG